MLKTLRKRKLRREYQAVLDEHRQGKGVLVYERLRSLLKELPEDAELHTVFADVEHQLHGRSADFEQSLSIAHRDPRCYAYAAFIEGDILVREGRIEEGLESYRRGLHRDRTVANLSLFACKLYDVADNTVYRQEANEVFAQILQDDPGHEVANQGLAYALMLKEDWPGALRHLEAIAGGEDPSLTAQYRGVCLANMGQIEAAMPHLICGQADGVPSAFVELGKTLVQSGRIGEARALVERQKWSIREMRKVADKVEAEVAAADRRND